MTVSAAVRADQTRLLEVDLATGSQRSIDKQSAKRADAALDSLLAEAMGRSFSTADLGKVSGALRRLIQTMRPPANARLLLFFYPGRVTRVALKEMREIAVDIDLLIEPCRRTVCTGAVAMHLELIGRALGSNKLQFERYRIRFGTVSVRAVGDQTPAEIALYRYPAADVIAAAKQRSGLALVRRVANARAGFEKRAQQKLAAQLRSWRVRSASAAEVARDGAGLSVKLTIYGDRVRFRSQVLAALLAVGKSVALDPHAPTAGKIELVLLDGRSKRRFSCPLAALRRAAQGQLDATSLWSDYVAEQRRGAKQMVFTSDADGDPPDAAQVDPSALLQVVSSNFNQLAPCLRAEAQRRSSFKGLTLKFEVTGRGGVERLAFEKGSGSLRLRVCLQRALGQLPFPRHGGATQTLRYPVYIDR
ncbi:MAG: hypothetical protein H6707_05475 [Deltaproteobacteria bacterium]|nr:hypothetical protein [Deltaproteobacteria bacterium]